LICYYAENPSPDALEGFENEFFSVPGLKEAVNGYMTEIREYGARATIVRLLNE
jgi:hypothetical protein